MRITFNIEEERAVQALAKYTKELDMEKDPFKEEDLVDLAEALFESYSLQPEFLMYKLDKEEEKS